MDPNLNNPVPVPKILLARILILPTVVLKILNLRILFYIRILFIRFRIQHFSFKDLHPDPSSKDKISVVDPDPYWIRIGSVFRSFPDPHM